MIHKQTGFDITITIDLNGQPLSLAVLDRTLVTVSRFYNCEWPGHHFWVTREDIGRSLMYSWIVERADNEEMEKKLVLERWHEPSFDLHLPDRQQPVARIVNFRLPVESE